VSTRITQPDGGAPCARHLQGERHVLLGRPILEQAEVLKHDPQPPPQVWDIPGDRSATV
jgi:hypothetical protein